MRCAQGSEFAGSRVSRSAEKQCGRRWARERRERVYTCCAFDPQRSRFCRGESPRNTFCQNRFSFGKVSGMPSYLVQVSYSSEALAALIANPQDRTEVVKKVAKKLGGKIHGAWLSFGEYDLVMVMEMPDNVSAAAIALASAAGGSYKTVK